MSVEQLGQAADILGPLLSEVVFVGGATIHLWLSDPAAPPARATDDVDVICDVTTRSDYYRLGSRLRERGLREAVDEPVICRWRHRELGLVIDVMPVSEAILGFSNPWYETAIATAVEYRLTAGKVTEPPAQRRSSRPSSPRGAAVARATYFAASTCTTSSRWSTGDRNSARSWSPPIRSCGPSSPPSCACSARSPSSLT